MMRGRRILAALLACGSAHAHEVSTDDWVRIGERVHGGYGSLIALGVRIGQDALERLSAAPRDLDVTYTEGEQSPCACVVDGVLIATSASPGQGTLRVAAERAGADTLGIVQVRHRRTGAQLRYLIPASALPVLAKLNREADARGRHAAVMAAPASDWYRVERPAR